MPSILLVGVDDASRSEFTEELCPNITAFRATATDFPNVWSHPVCSQSRAAIAYGAFGKKIGTIGDLGAFSTPPHPSPTWPSLAGQLKAAGYATALIGKNHTGGAPSGAHWAFGPIERGYDQWLAGNGLGLASYSNWQRVDSDALGFVIDDHETTYATQAQVDAALLWWDSHPGQKFLHVAINAPHGPFHVPPVSLLNGWPQPPATGGARRAQYLAALRTADTVFGMLMAVVSPSTIVVLYSDNGTPPQAPAPGQDISKMKGTTFRDGCNVICVGRWGSSVPGSTDNKLAHLVDIPYGILIAAGVPAPPEWDGYLAQRPYVLSEASFVGGAQDRAIRTNKFLLRQETTAGEQLYDLLADPTESIPVDLEDPKYSSQLAYLRTQLDLAAI